MIYPENTYMKDIHFIHANMYMGGGEKALLCLLKNFDTAKYDVSLSLSFEGGELLDDVPEAVSVEVHPWTELARDCAALPFGKRMRYIYYAMRLKAAGSSDKTVWLARIYDLCHHAAADAVLAYALAPISTVILGALSTAKYKAVWVHCLLDGDEEYYCPAAPFLREYQTVFCVSEAVRASFCRVFPAYADKAVVMYNLIAPEEIRALADEKVLPREPDTFTLCTVTRLSNKKGTEMIPGIVRRLTDDGYRVKWYLVGDGDKRETVEQLAQEYGVTDRLILCGTKKNPYPYMNCCDVYVQPTGAEGFGLSVQEARILCKPIVATDIPAMREQLENGENALLVDWTAGAYAEGIEKLLDSPELRARFCERLKGAVYDNRRELEKLYGFIGE